jgi:type III pantothenate kinase
VLVAVVGRLVPRKGQDVFLDAVRILAQDGLPIRAVIVGEPPARPDTGERAYLERLLTLAVHPALRSRVEFQGFRDDVPALLAASDIVVMPSVNDPFPLALIEAMAAGAAVVATDSGGHAEAIEDGVTGLLVPPRDPSALAAAVARLAWDVLFRGNLAAAARRSAVERFSPETLPARLEVLYRDALRIPSGGYPLIAAKSTDLVEPWILRRSPSRSEPPDWEPTSTAVDRREAP